jgi:hypothetical protein
MSIVLQGSTSGSITLQEPAVAGTTTINLPATSGTALVAPTALTVPNTTGTVMVSGNMPAFSAYKSSGQSLSSGTFTKITFDTEEFDTNSNFASSRFTPTVAGYYQITGVVNNSTGTQTVSTIYKNGSILKNGTNSSAYSAVATALIYLIGSTDYVELYGYFGTGTSTGSGAEQTYFQGVLVRAA